jgi:DNA-directed RNA polymerase specialized sigma24 family protein
MSTVAVPRATGKRLKPELDRLFREHHDVLHRTAFSLLGNVADICIEL